MIRWAGPAPWSIWEKLAVAVTTLLGLVLRLVDYTAAPDRHDNPDEVQFAWLGMSLLRDHVPTTWSYFPEYPHPTFLATPDGLTWPLVTPWFDHPPLFGLLIGGAAILGGATDFASVTTAAIRLPSILLATACIPLAFTLARRVMGRTPAVLAAILLASAPVAVLYGRSVEPEAVIAPLLLVALIAVHRVLSGEGGRVTWALLFVCCFIAPLAKVPGVAIGGISAVALLTGGRPRAAAGSVVAAVVGLGAFAAYGAAYDWRLFAAVFAEQAAHRTGVMSGIDFIVDPAGLNRRLRDGWWLLGWLGIGALLVRGRGTAAQVLVAWPAVAYAAAMLVMADDRVTAFGWYRIAIYPLLYIAAGGLAFLAVRKRPASAAVVALLITGGATASAEWLVGNRGPAIAAAVLAIVIGVLAVAAWRPNGRGWQAAARVVARSSVALALVGNVVVSLRLASNYLRL